MRCGCAPADGPDGASAVRRRDRRWHRRPAARGRRPARRRAAAGATWAGALGGRLGLGCGRAGAGALPLAACGSAVVAVMIGVEPVLRMSRICLRVRAGEAGCSGVLIPCSGRGDASQCIGQPRRERGTTRDCRRCTRSRQSVDEMARAGISSWLTSSVGRPAVLNTCPGRETATKWARSHNSSWSLQLRICAKASAPVMKNSSASGRWSSDSRSVSIV